MEEMRAILDSLMGSDRNNVTNESNRMTFRDPGICHAYLVDFCPHDLFPNTKSDLGPCPNRHSDILKEQYLNDPEFEYYKKKYEKELLNTLHRLVEGVEERIRRGQQRILGPDESHVEQEKQRKCDQMKDEIAVLLQKAQEAGEKGNIAEAETYTRKVTEIRCDLDRMTNVPHDYLTISNQERSLRVCPVCGAMQSLGDATSRFESHVSGKQHVGYERIRSTYIILKAKYRPDSDSTDQLPIAPVPKNTGSLDEGRIPSNRKSIDEESDLKSHPPNGRVHRSPRTSYQKSSRPKSPSRRYNDRHSDRHYSSKRGYNTDEYSSRNYRRSRDAYYVNRTRDVYDRSPSHSRKYPDDHSPSQRSSTSPYYKKSRRSHDRSRYHRYNSPQRHSRSNKRRYDSKSPVKERIIEESQKKKSSKSTSKESVILDSEVQTVKL